MQPVEPMSAISDRLAMQVATVLSRCAIACAKSANGYARAAIVIQEPSLRAFLESTARQRETFARDLERFVAATGARPEASSPPPPASDRWTEPPMLDGQAERMVLEDSDRDEREVQRRLEIARSELSRKDLPRSVRDSIDAQYAAVCKARYEIDRHLFTASGLRRLRQRRPDRD